MIRIMKSNHADGITITVDGRLAGDYVDAVEMSVHQAMDQGRPVHLFLRDVSVIDENGHTLLSRLASKGVELSASGVYSAYVVAEVRREPASGMRRPRPATMSGIGSSAGHTAERRPTAETKSDRCDGRGRFGDTEKEQL
jgi:hypothetical protein